jgi:hypothetical protein
VLSLITMRFNSRRASPEVEIDELAPVAATAG